MTPLQKIASLEARIAQLQTRLAGQTKVASGADAQLQKVQKLLTFAQGLLKKIFVANKEYEAFHNLTLETLSDLSHFHDAIQANPRYSDKKVENWEGPHSSVYDLAIKDAFHLVARGQNHWQYPKDLSIAVSHQAILKDKGYDFTVHQLQDGKNSFDKSIDAVSNCIDTCEGILQYTKKLYDPAAE